MKKAIIAALFLVSISTLSFAQTPVKKDNSTQKKEAPKTEKKMEKKEVAKHHVKHHASKKKAEGTK